jgi:hypothetical protein
MPDRTVVDRANATGPLLGDWAIDNSRGGPLAGHDHVEVRAVAGAGKTTWSARAIVRAVTAKRRVLVCAFTNAQVIELATKVAEEAVKRGQRHPRLVHLAKVGNVLAPAPQGLYSTSDKRDPQVRNAECLLATCHKSAYSAADVGTFDVGFVDEAYQVRSDVAALVALSLAPRWAFVGDPGQIAVFSTVPVRWDQTADPVSSVVASARASGADIGALFFDWSFRVPHAVAAPLESFYGFPVRVSSLPGDRRLILGAGTGRGTMGKAADRVWDRAERTQWGLLELPGDAYGPADPETATAIAALVVSLWQRRPRAICEEHPRGKQVRPPDVAVAVATNDQVAAVTLAIKRALEAAGCPDPERNLPTITTYNKHQGLTYPVTIAWHPLSGATRSEEFAIDLGRWCVGITRHRHACIIVGREGLRDVLADPPLSGAAPRPGERNRFLEGWLAHAEVLHAIDEAKATVRVR